MLIFENPLFFPCLTGNLAETGSLETPCTTTETVFSQSARDFGAKPRGSAGFGRSLANSYSRGDREFEKAPAMPFPSEIAQRGRMRDHIAAHFRRRVTV